MENPNTGTAEALLGLANTYFDAAYAMDADQFSTIFHPHASITRGDDRGGVVVTPVAAWLDAVRGMESPHQTSETRRDELLSIELSGHMAVLKLRLRLPPRIVTDLLTCLHVNGRWQIVQKVFSAETLP